MTNLFRPALFAKTLTVTACAAIIGCAVAFRLQGELAARDIIGCGISTVLFSYMVHLWIALAREEAAH